MYLTKNDDNTYKMAENMVDILIIWDFALPIALIGTLLCKIIENGMLNAVMQAPRRNMTIKYRIILELYESNIIKIPWDIALTTNNLSDWYESSFKYFEVNIPINTPPTIINISVAVKISGVALIFSLIYGIMSVV